MPRLFLVSPSLPLVFLGAFWADKGLARERAFYLEAPKDERFVITDASPWGLGALLVVPSSHAVLACFDAPLTAADEETLGFAIGDPAAQALLEILAVFVALSTWLRFFKARRRRLTLRADSSAALGALDNMSSSKPAGRS